MGRGPFSVFGWPRRDEAPPVRPVPLDVADEPPLYELEEPKESKHAPGRFRGPSVDIREVPDGVLEDTDGSCAMETDQPRETKPDLEQPYHMFSKTHKWSVVVIIGLAGLFSGLSSNIYFPSLDQISQVSTMTDDLHLQPSACSGLPC